MAPNVAEESRGRKGWAKGVKPYLERCINDLKPSILPWKRLVPSSCRAKIPKNQAPNLIVLVADLQHKLNAQHGKVSPVKVRALTARNGVRKSGMRTYRKPLMKLGVFNPWFWWGFFSSRSSSFPCHKKTPQTGRVLSIRHLFSHCSRG